MMSKWILALALALSFLWATADISCHGHYSCDRIQDIVKDAISDKEHLLEYIDPDRLDYSGQPESGIVECRCIGRKIVLTGKVVNDSIRREFSDIAAAQVGQDLVDNQIQVFNHEAMKELQGLLSEAPTNLNMNYIIRDRGTVVLTGDLPNDSIKEKITSMVEKIRGVRTVVNELGKHLEVQRVLRIHNIYFDFNKWNIRPESEVRLDEVAEKLETFFDANAEGTVRIEGHTDSIASPKYNIWLSQKRAQACLDALVKRGLSADKLSAVGKGESHLLVEPDNTPEKRSENRRIEFHFE